MKSVIARLVGAALILTPLLAQAEAATPAPMEGAPKKTAVTLKANPRPTRLPVVPKSSAGNVPAEHGPVKPVPTAHLPRGVSPSVGTHGDTPSEGTPKKREDIGAGTNKGGSCVGRGCDSP